MKALRLGALLALCGSAFAQVLYTQTPVEGAEGGPFSDQNQVIADSFDPDSSGTVLHVKWWGSFFADGDPFPSGGDRDFEIVVYDDNSGEPGTGTSSLVTASFAATSFSTSGGDRVYEFEADVSGFVVSSGTTYWLSILDNEDTSSFRWHNGSGPGTASAYSFGEGDWLFDPSGRPDLAFELQAVPEPGTLAALGLGAAALLARRRRK